MTVKTAPASSITTIPISLLLTRGDEHNLSRTNSQSPGCHHVTPPNDSPAEVSEECSSPRSGVSTPRDENSHSSDSDTIVVASCTKHKPSPVGGMAYSGSAKSTTRQRKRTAGSQKAGADDSGASKRRRRPQTNHSHVLDAPVTPPMTPSTACPERPTPQPAPTEYQTNLLPPTSIVTKSNRVTQEFRNGVTSVQVPPEHTQTKVQATGADSPPPREEISASASDLPRQTEPARPEGTPVGDRNNSPQAQRTQSPSPNCQTTNRQSGYGQPAVNWDCHTHVIQDQKVYTTYEKPNKLTSNAAGANANAPQQAYNKMTTKTVTITITTTIATTEILRPGEPGYEESLERHRRQSKLSVGEKEQLRNEYEGSRAWANPDGARRLNDERHWSMHKVSDPAGRAQKLAAPASVDASNANISMNAVENKQPIVEKQGEKEVRIKIEVPEDCAMEDVQEFVKVKVEEVMET